MTLDYTVKRQVTIDICDYTKKILDKFPKEELHGTIKIPWSKDLFKVKEDSPKLSTEKRAVPQNHLPKIISMQMWKA